LNQISHKVENKSPVLFKYLKHYTSPSNTNIYSLNYLKKYNEVLNMFNDKYSHIIERGDDKIIILENKKFILDCKIFLQSCRSLINGHYFLKMKKITLKKKQEMK